MKFTLPPLEIKKSSFIHFFSLSCMISPNWPSNRDTSFTVYEGLLITENIQVAWGMIFFHDYQ